MASLLVKKLMKLTAGTAVELTCDEGDVNNQKLVGVVTDNDGEESLEIRLENGEEQIISYSLIQRVKTLKNEEPGDDDNKKHQKRDLLQNQEPEDVLNRSDNALKELFGNLPYEDKRLLSSAYDSFKYGVRINERGKMEGAAKQARQILFREDDKKYYWSTEAVDFCASLLRRVYVYDSEVCLVADRLYEAAYCCWKNKEHEKAGLCAITALLEKAPEHPKDLFIILAAAVVGSEDISGLTILGDHLPAAHSGHMQQLLSDLLEAKGVRLSAGQDREAAMKLLRTMYKTGGMGKKLVDWLPKELAAQYSKPVSKKADPVPTPQIISKPETAYGVIARVDWTNDTGTIRSDDGRSFSFRYKELRNADVVRELRECMRSDMGGKVYDVKFQVQGSEAVGIQITREFVERARAIAAGSREDRIEVAFELCKRALETSDVRRASGDLIKYALGVHSAKGQTNVLKEAVKLCEKHSASYPINAFAYMDLAQCYGYLKKHPQVLEYGHKALDCAGLSLAQKVDLLVRFLKLARGAYDASGDKRILADMLERIHSAWEDYGPALDRDTQTRNNYMNCVIPYRLNCACVLDKLEEAEEAWLLLPGGHTYRESLLKILEQTRERLAPVEEPEPEKAPEEEEQELPGDVPEESWDEPDEEEAPKEPAQPEPEEDDTPVAPYVDTDGWDALKLTKADVVDYALGITGDDRLAPMLAYLRVGAALNPQIRPVYHAVALAVNDPLEKPDYSPTAILNALADGDTEYPELNNLCMGAAFLRSSFLYGKDYDYSTQSLRDSLAIDKQMPSLPAACDTLDEFRREAGRPIDIYAEYRNQDLLKVKEELEQTAAHADELYTKFILTPPREGADFYRLWKTKQMVFDQEGYLATMLRGILNRDQETLEAEREQFASRFLSGSGSLESRHVSQTAVDQLIADTWDEAGKNMLSEKNNNTLQGDRRNNLRSSISDILRTITRWYVLSEQSAGLTWQTKQGEQAYARLSPVLREQLEQLARDCDDLRDGSTDPQTGMGLFLLAYTARELRGHLDGSWKYGQENYLYIDLLRSGWVTLDEDFKPDLSATFCVLPEFNILCRLRRHVEEPRRSFQEQIDRIYGPDTTFNDYGTADRIADYLQAMGGAEQVTFPENPKPYIDYTKMQIEIRYRSFLETYALAMNYGQIIKSDAFCYTLEDTVRYWHRVCRTSRNYGFFASLLLHAENQIHASARQYEEQLEEQLDALISSNPQDFDRNPDYAEAIRAQIANQNFTVAEDWMARIRIGDFSLDVQQPEALGYLNQYASAAYMDIYKKVAFAKRPLDALLGRREIHNKDTTWAQQLIDNWLNRSPSNSGQIRQLLNLLGWQNITVAQQQHPTEPRTEFYRVERTVDRDILTAPQHPIAAFGSDLERGPMYVTCLYGIYDCDRLYDKMRATDGLDGTKIVLLDCALSQQERRELARKLKRRESDLRNVHIVIDRVLITYLADHYNENLINRILMATAMPFSYCQPYVVDSSLTMPPEIFIGRKDELMKIEQPDGVNLIYGGRQLGKSALFKKAVFDLDGRRSQRAVLVDIKDLKCAEAARKVSLELIQLGVTPNAEVTDNWDVLCQNIKTRLRSKTDEIRYFLLMLDEADEFIKDCIGCNFRPLVALKDVQQSLPGRFKYVLAGLHNIVKFHRQVALGKNSVITHMSSLKITPFRNPEAQELLTVPLSYLGFSLPSKVTVSQILATCNYFPGLIQLYAKKLIESLREADYAGYSISNSPPYVVTDEHLRRVMSDKEFIAQIHEKFEITLTLDEDQGSCYYPLALLIGWMYYLEPSRNGYTAQDVLRCAVDYAVKPLNGLDEEKIDALLQELQDLNILRSVTNNSYLLASKNFRDLLGSDEEINEKLTKIGGGA